MTTKPDERTHEERVLLLPPTARDGRLTTAFLAEAGIACVICADIPALCAAIEQGGGVVVLHEEALGRAGLQQLVTSLIAQPVWSDLPIIVLVGSVPRDGIDVQLRQQLGNVLLLERPVRIATLLSAVQTALRTRRRQYQVRLLADVGQLLTSSLDAQATLDQLPTLLVPRIADVCSLYLVENGNLRRASQGWRDPQRAEFAAMLGRNTTAEASMAAIWQVIRQGAPDLREAIESDTLLALELNAKQRELVAQIGIHSHVLLPLIVQGRATGVLALGMNVSSRKFSAADLPFMGELTDRLAPALENLRLYAAEQHARAEAEQAISARDELLALVSHDLKNPLTSLLGQTQLLQRRVSGQTSDNERLGRGLAIIERSALRMRAQINTLLDAIHLRAGQQLDLQRVPVELVAFIYAAVESFDQTTERHTLRFETSCERLAVDLDTARFERVIDNLLSNAVKYSPSGGAVVVTLGSEQHASGTFAVVRVQDWGLGIPADELPHLFAPFRRATNVRKQIDGTGLGLVSVRQIVEAHEGWVDVQSVAGQGSVFTVALPVK